MLTVTEAVARRAPHNRTGSGAHKGHTSEKGALSLSAGAAVTWGHALNGLHMGTGNLLVWEAQSPGLRCPLGHALSDDATKEESMPGLSAAF